jgi:hypothetical protein
LSEPIASISAARGINKRSQTRALFLRAIGAARCDPSKEERLRACGAQYTMMPPWAAELCLDRLGRERLYEPGEKDA